MDNIIGIGFVLFLLIAPFLLGWMCWAASHQRLVTNMESMCRGWPHDSTISTEDKIKAKAKFPEELQRYRIKGVMDG